MFPYSFDHFDPRMNQASCTVIVSHVSLVSFNVEEQCLHFTLCHPVFFVFHDTNFFLFLLRMQSISIL